MVQARSKQQADDAKATKQVHDMMEASAMYTAGGLSAGHILGLSIFFASSFAVGFTIWWVKHCDLSRFSDDSAGYVSVAP